jgi:hypothetical protein
MNDEINSVKADLEKAVTTYLHEAKIMPEEYEFEFVLDKPIECLDMDFVISARIKSPWRHIVL